MVDAVVANDVVFALEQQEYQWVVTGIDSVDEYVRLKNIFEDLEFIDTFFLGNYRLIKSCLVSPQEHRRKKLLNCLLNGKFS